MITEALKRLKKHPTTAIPKSELTAIAELRSTKTVFICAETDTHYILKLYKRKGVKANLVLWLRTGSIDKR
jgi:hypothetical protein